MRVLVLSAAFMLGIGQQVPPNLPPANRVTDPARPDVGYMRPWAGSVLTIAVVFGAACRPCDESVPFYKTLASHPAVDGKAGRFVVLAEGGIAPVAARIEQRPDGFRLSKIVSYPADDRFRIRETPTLLVFDGAWRKRGEWSGRLTAVQEKEVRTLIQTILAASGKGGVNE